ncbi:MAG: efflux RND transporter permease subunit [Rickettsiales bacterium]|jgi:HAE1 family hydrophobic/amphiphilic exporter-1|nr:efflux RND transporter permease subunit [Rickettsiales bacterium]
MIKFFVKHPVTTVMFVLLWIVLGVVAYPKMNVERTPAIEFQMVTASFVYPGASPDEVESQVVKKTEDAVSEVAGIKKITSQSFENGGFVMVEFNLGVNVNDKASEVKAKLESIEGEFPDSLKKPVVEKLNPLQESVLDIVLTGAASRDLERYVDDVLGRQITSVPGVASVSVYGGDKRAVRVFLNPEQMAARGLAVSDVVGAVAARNLNVPGGKLEFGDSSNVVRFVGEFASVYDIADLQILTSEGASLRLREIARVEDSALDKTTGARYNGQSVVIASVVKSSDGNAIKISRELKKRIPQMQQSMRDYFAARNAAAGEISMKIISDSSVAIGHETNTTIRDIVLGLALTVLTLLVFTRNWRTTVIAGVMIPASLVSGFFFMDASGFTINAMTLVAIATALGTLITDAIVLIESALGLIEKKGYTPEDAAVEGTKKVAVRIFATIATHVVVFLPLAFMGGIAGRFMQQFGLSVVYLVLISSMFSFTLTPMMIAKILKKREDKKTLKMVRPPKSDMEELGWFKKFFDWQINKPWCAVGLAALALVVSVIPMRWVGNEFTSNADVNEISVFARADAGATYQKSEALAAQIEQRLKQFKEVDFVSVKIGDRGVQNINVKVGLVDAGARRKTDKQLVYEIVPALADIPGAEIQVHAGESMAGMANDLVLNVSGEDDATREKYAARIVGILNEIPEIQSAVLAAQKPGTELKFVPDDGRMKLWGVRNQTAGAALRTALYGNDDYKYKENGAEYPIVLELAKEYKNHEMFDSVFIGTPKGLVSLAELGAVETGAASADIRKIDKNRITEIDINLGKSTIGPVQKKIEAELQNIDWQPGYGASFGGMSEMQAESTAEISNAFLLATILTFMVLAAILNSLAHPFTIVTSILTSFAGVFVLMFLVGANINIAAMMSLVMLVGLAVSTNILILEPTLEEMGRGVPAAQALWEQFADKKRMLVMTTVAVVAGLIPQLWASDGIKVSMGAVIIGGILASLFWTFFLTPAVFTLMERLRRKTKRK